MSYSGPITDPFRIPAPDGHVYFDALTAPVALAPIYVGLATLITRCRAEAARHTDPAYRAFYTGWATRFDATAKLLRTQLAAIGVQTAAVADQSIKRHIKSTQVRPNTSKADHLGDQIVSRHIAQRVEGGAVGVADVRVLDKAQQGGGTYWEAQEFGTDAHVGRQVRGFFMPGRSRPDQGSFRVHPEFQAGRGPRMTINRPIRERGFLRRGVEDAGNFRARRYASLDARVRAEIDKFIIAAGGLSPPRTPPRNSGSSRRR